MKVGVSFLKHNKSVEETITDIDNSSADYIHVDMMDGIFAGDEANYTIQDIKKLTKDCNKKLDVHMMVCSPNKYINTIYSMFVFKSLPQYMH